jgi:hypothetical protein
LHEPVEIGERGQINAKRVGGSDEGGDRQPKEDCRGKSTARDRGRGRR